MKKLMTLAAVVAACAPAFTAEVTSSNIVGYQKIALGENAMDILGAQFQPISGTASIQDISTSGHFDIEGGDWIKWYDATNRRYTTAYWWGVDDEAEVYGVYDPADEDYENPLGAGWGDGDAFIIEGSIPAGKAFWGKAVNGGQVVVSGEVPTSGVVSLGANAMDLVCNPFPVDTNIQDISVSGNFDIEGGDWIKWYDAENRRYITAYFWGVDDEAEVYGVYDPADEDYENPLGAGWGDGDAFIVNGTIPSGHGFWCKTVKGGTLVFPSPVSAE